MFMRSLILAGAGLAFSLVGQAATEKWDLDPQHSAAYFSVRHMMISNVKGQFGKTSGTALWDPQDPSKSSVTASVDTTTIDTREPQRDTHLKSPEFLDSAKFPTMTFQSKRVEKSGDGKLRLIGDLTIHGVTKETAFDVDGPSAPIKDQRGGMHMGASATAKISRKDFGLNWNRAMETGGVLVGDEVTITLDIELVKGK
jgi:polyisoprenoid-binding protein YceI